MLRGNLIHAVTVLCVGAAAAVCAGAGFDADVRPILSDRCYVCHGPDPGSRKAGLRLDQPEGLFTFVKPHAPADSELLQRISSADPGFRMPPPEQNVRLTSDEIDVIRRWILDGAPYQGHWAFSAPVLPSPPPAASPWVRNPIDQFVLQRLEREGQVPSPEADPDVLLRRVSFDLTGLPPTPQDREAFLSDPSPPTAYLQAVDRLLASESYGERMASDWLDVARYSDSFGYQRDQHRRVWPWRDWVIEAFNRNLPYDQFVTWQLAGDLLPSATDEQILATAFSRLHPQKVEGGSVPEEFRVEYVADRVRTFGTAFLGLTLDCARCHDHKFDPLPTADYYRLFAFFNNIDEAGLYSFFTSSTPTPTLRLEDESGKRQREALEDRVARAGRALDAEPDYRRWRRGDSTRPSQEGLLAYFAFDEDVPGTHANAITNQPPATTGGENHMVEGFRGRAIQLSGDDPVKLTQGNFARTEPFSIALRLWTPEVKERAVVFHRSRAWTDAGSRGYQLLMEDGRLSASLIHFWPGNALRVRTTSPIEPRRWTHVMMTYDGSSRATGLRLYLDGAPVEVEIIRDALTRTIKGGGQDHIHIGERFRDRGFNGGRIDDFALFSRELNAPEVRDAFAGAEPDRPPVAPATFSPAVEEKRAALRHAREELAAWLDGAEEIMVMREMPAPRTTRVLERGRYDAPGREVRPATPAALPPLPAGQPANRLGLARWLTDPTHPLTARVAVNRAWQLHFGRGLVKTAEDFGMQGDRPSHPELLDWLAVTFIESGWDLKALHRLIVTSATYRQDSDAAREAYRDDPDNRLLARGPRYRLPAEMLRDQALTASDLLVQRVGGPPVRPYDLAESFIPSGPGKGEDLYRRSLYGYWQRTAPSPLLMSFDAAKREVCTVRRDATTSPLQALVLLNAPQFVEAARVLAEHLLQVHGANEEALLRDAFLRLTGQEPTPATTRILRELLREQARYYDTHPGEAAALCGTGARAPSDDLDPVRTAAATMTISTLMNYDLSVMKR